LAISLIRIEWASLPHFTPSVNDGSKCYNLWLTTC
jgi:hypothetical protein